VIPFLQRELAHVRALVEEVEAQIQAFPGQIPEAAVMQELARVGPQVAAAVLAFLLRAVWGWAKAAASYAGLISEREEFGKMVEQTRLSRKGPPILMRKL